MSRRKQIEEIRNFNRFYLLRFQMLNERKNATKTSFVELTILETLNERKQLLASDLACHLNLSKSYTSQVIGRLESKGLIRKECSFQDERCKLIRLTTTGLSMLKEEQLLYDRRLERFISKLSDQSLNRLLEAMKEIYEVTKTTLSTPISFEGAD